MVRSSLKQEPTSLLKNITRATFEVDTRDREKPIVKLELWAGGKERYRYVSFSWSTLVDPLMYSVASLRIPGSPVKISYTMALGAFIPGGFTEILDRIGMKPSKWF
jgi:alkaline phosphatase D